MGDLCFQDFLEDKKSPDLTSCGWWRLVCTDSKYQYRVSPLQLRSSLISNGGQMATTCWKTCSFSHASNSKCRTAFFFLPVSPWLLPLMSLTFPDILWQSEERSASGHTQVYSIYWLPFQDGRTHRQAFPLALNTSKDEAFKQKPSSSINAVCCQIPQHATRRCASSWPHLSLYTVPGVAQEATEGSGCQNLLMLCIGGVQIFKFPSHLPVAVVCNMHPKHGVLGSCN